MACAFLSPCVCAGNYGGVQLSGSIARDALALAEQPYLDVCYRSQPGPRLDHVGCTDSRIAAAVQAIRIRSQVNKVLVWHVDMLKLLPLVKPRGSGAFLFLHGIEAWRKLDGIWAALLRLVDVFLTNSQFTWSRFIDCNPEWHGSTHRVVPLGLGITEPSQVQPDDRPAAIVVGRMDRREGYKGHKELLRAWPDVLRCHPRAELWLVGGGDLEMELRRAVVSTGLKESVKFYGRVKDEVKLQLIRRARCLLLPSRGEGFGLVYLEAMRQGRPCLVSTVDAGQEVVNPPEAGLSVDPEDLDAVSASVSRLLTAGPEWELWSARARALYESTYTAAHFEQRLLAALDH
jgi:phosphatidylinositol alpha-1,6-mannosyltransferase